MYDIIEGSMAVKTARTTPTAQAMGPKVSDISSKV